MCRKSSTWYWIPREPMAWNFSFYFTYLLETTNQYFPAKSIYSHRSLMKNTNLFYNSCLKRWLLRLKAIGISVKSAKQSVSEDLKLSLALLYEDLSSFENFNFWILSYEQWHTSSLSLWEPCVLYTTTNAFIPALSRLQGASWGRKNIVITWFCKVILEH